MELNRLGYYGLVFKIDNERIAVGGFSLRPLTAVLRGAPAGIKCIVHSWEYSAVNNDCMNLKIINYWKLCSLFLVLYQNNDVWDRSAKNTSFIAIL